MKRICAWCKKELQPGHVDGVSDGLITHGICDKCAENLHSSPRSTARNFLETLDEPVFLVNRDAKFIATNHKARDVVGKDASEIEDHLCGEVLSAPIHSFRMAVAKQSTARHARLGSLSHTRLPQGKAWFVSQPVRTSRGLTVFRASVS
jgi:PAS domain-containing protein